MLTHKGRNGGGSEPKPHLHIVVFNLFDINNRVEYFDTNHAAVANNPENMNSICKK